jgi:hypothetical protein
MSQISLHPLLPGKTLGDSFTVILFIRGAHLNTSFTKSTFIHARFLPDFLLLLLREPSRKYSDFSSLSVHHKDNYSSIKCWNAVTHISWKRSQFKWRITLSRFMTNLRLCMPAQIPSRFNTIAPKTCPHVNKSSLKTEKLGSWAICCFKSCSASPGGMLWKFIKLLCERK